MNLSLLAGSRAVAPGAHARVSGEVTGNQPETAGGIVFFALYDETGFCGIPVEPMVGKYKETLRENKKATQARVAALGYL